MKRLRFNEAQVVAILKEAGARKAVAEICGEHGISNATYYAWKSKYGGMDASELKRIRQPCISSRPSRRAETSALAWMLSYNEEKSPRLVGEYTAG